MKCVGGLLVLVALATTSAVHLPGIPAAFSGNLQIASAISDDVARKFADEYIRYMRTGIESAALRQMSEQLASSHSEANTLLRRSLEELDGIDQFFVCTACRAGVRVISSEFRTPGGELHGEEGQARLRLVAMDVCRRLRLGPPEMCVGYFDISFDFIEFIMHESNADSQTACSILPLPICNVKQNEFNITLNIDKSGPAVTGPKSDFPGKTDKDWHIVQVTDIHYDPDYKPGSLATCDYALCCREEAEPSVAPTHLAGYWSDYRGCDTPWHMLENALDHIVATHKSIDYVYYTGDVVPHNFWETTREFNRKIIHQVDTLMAEKFPDTPIYPVVGNHESHPSNIFGTNDMAEEVSISWLYEALWESWSRWLPASTKDTILEGGFYTLSPRPGFRIISVNSNYGYIYNFFLFHDGNIAARQLQWLHDTLLAAEKAGEHVHILMHMATGSSDCWSVFGREFNRIAERFNHIIGGIFVGHTHRDELHVHYNRNGYAIGHTFNGGSLTSYTYKNPNYKLYEVNPDTLQVVDFHTWMFNVTEANVYGEQRLPQWQKAYTFSEEFSADLSPAGLDKLLYKMAEQPDLLHKFWSYKGSLSDPMLAWGCDNRCLLRTICHTARSAQYETQQCRELQDILRQNLPGDDTTTASPSSTSGPGTTPSTTKKPNGEDGEDDGASAMAALSISTMLAMCAIVGTLL